MRQKQNMYHEKAKDKHSKHINKMEFEMKINEQWERQREKEKEKKDYQEFTFTASDADFPQTTVDNRYKYAAFAAVVVVCGVLWKRFKS